MKKMMIKIYQHYSYKKHLKQIKKRAKKLGIEYVDGIEICDNVSNWGAKVIMKPFSRIGSNTILWGRGTITIGEHSSIGENSWIFASPEGGVTFGNDVNCAANMYVIDADHSFKKGELIRTQPLNAKPIFIGNDVWIGANVTILKGSNIGDGSVIGACSLVNKSFESNSIIGGIPARKLKERI